jgi:hypothetical protein
MPKVMLILKKLLFAPFFLITLYFTLELLRPFFESYNQVFAYNLDSLGQRVLISALLILASFFYVLFVSLANEWIYVFPVALVAGLISLMLFPLPTAYVISVGLIISLLLIFLLTQRRLKTYISFSPHQLFFSPIKNLSLLIVLFLSFGFYLTVNSEIHKKGFEVPDSFLDLVIKMASSSMQVPVQGQKYLAQIPTLTKEQIDLLKQHPEFLQQYGIDPKDLDSIPTSAPQATTKPKSGTTTPNTSLEPIQVPTTLNSLPTSLQPSNDFLKTLIKSQLQNMVKPYLGILPILFALTFFATFYTFISLLSFLIPLLLWLTFYILEQSKFIHFTKELRPVKKMAV